VVHLESKKRHLLSGCEVDRYEDPLQQVCEDVEAMEIATQGGRCDEDRGMCIGAGTERDQTTKDRVDARIAPAAFSIRIFGA
jgi:hypothetical protein